MTTDTNAMDEDQGRAVKVCKGEEVRRFHFKGRTFEQLKNEISTLYKFNSPADFILQYQDDEDDRITLSTDLELTEAERISKGILRFFVIDKSSSSSSPSSSSSSPSSSSAASHPSFDPRHRPPPHHHHHQHPPSSMGAYVPPHQRHHYQRSYGPPPQPPPFHHHDAHSYGPPPPHPPPHHHPHHYHHHRGSMDGGEEESPRGANNYKQWARKSAAGKRYAPFDKEERKREKAEKAERKQQKEIDKEEDPEKRQWKISKKEIKQRWKETKKISPQSWPENKKLMIQELKDLKSNYKIKSAVNHGQLVARHVRDVTVPDGSEISPKTPFVKTWCIRNEGAPWPIGCSLVFISRNGDRMEGPDHVPLNWAGEVGHGQEINVSVSLVSPASPGRYVGFWRLCTPEGRKFGQRVWVSIVVPATSSSNSTSATNATGNNGNNSSNENSGNDGSGSSGSSTPSSSGDEGEMYESAVKSITRMGFDVKKKFLRKMLSECDGNIEKVIGMLTEHMKALNTKS